MSTLAQMRANVRSEIIEPTPGFWTNAEIDAWLNDAAQEMTRMARIEVTTPVVIPTVVNQEFYSLPTDFYTMARVEREETPSQGDYTPLYRAELDNRYASATPDIPAMYYVWSTLPALLGLIPVPNAVWNVRVWYYRLQATLAAESDTPIIDPEWHSLIEKFAIAMAKRKSDDPAYQVYKEQYDAGLTKINRDYYQRREGNHFPMVQDDWDNVR